jgi:hypothetical protein
VTETHNHAIRINDNPISSLTFRMGIVEKKSPADIFDVFERRIADALQLNTLDLPLQIAALKVLAQSLETIMDDTQKAILDGFLKRSQISTINMAEAMRQSKEENQSDKPEENADSSTKRSGQEHRGDLEGC